MTRQFAMLCFALLPALPAGLAYGQSPPPASATAAPAPVSAPAVVPPGAILLRYKFKVGDQHIYKMAMDNATTINAGGQSMPMNMHTDMEYRQTVLSVDPTTGNATVKMEFAPMTMTMNGSPMPVPASASNMPPITFTVTPSGKMVAMKTASPAVGAQNPLANMQAAASLPDGPVKPGDTWQVTQTVPGMGLSVQIPMSLADIEQSGGHTVARINQIDNITTSPTAGAPAGLLGTNATITGSGTVLFDADRGIPTSSDTKMHISAVVHAPGQTSGGGMPMVMDMHIVLTLADAAH